MFVFFLNIYAEDTECDKEFNVIIGYPSVFTISISADELVYTFSQEQADRDHGKPIRQPLGSFHIYTNVSKCTIYQVIIFSPPQYINDDGHFHCLCQHSGATTCTIDVVADEDAHGNPVETTLLDDQIVICGSSQGGLVEDQREIDVFATYIEFSGTAFCHCHIPLFFRLESA